MLQTIRLSNESSHRVRRKSIQCHCCESPTGIYCLTPSLHIASLTQKPPSLAPQSLHSLGPVPKGCLDWGLPLRQSALSGVPSPALLSVRAATTQSSPAGSGSAAVGLKLSMALLGLVTAAGQVDAAVQVAHMVMRHAGECLCYLCTHNVRFFPLLIRETDRDVVICVGTALMLVKRTWGSRNRSAKVPPIFVIFSLWEVVGSLSGPSLLTLF